MVVWLSGIKAGLDQRSYSMPGLVSTRMADRLQAGKLSWYVASHPAQLYPTWVDAMSTSKS